MKRLTSGLIALAFVASIPAAGAAQGTSGTERYGTDRGASERRASDGTKAARTKKDRPAWSNTQGLHETGDIIGTRVHNPEGKDIGKVEALLIDPTEGKITHAVVGIGGVLGIGDEKVVVPYTALKMTGHEGGRKGKIALDQSTLDAAPKYVKTSDRAPSASPATSPRSDSMPATNPATSPKADKK